MENKILFVKKLFKAPCPDMLSERWPSKIACIALCERMNFKADADWDFIDTIEKLNTETHALGRLISNEWHKTVDKQRKYALNKHNQWKYALQKRYGKKNVVAKKWLKPREHGTLRLKNDTDF